MRRYPVYYGGVSCGELTAEREGLYLRFFARVSFAGAGIPRIYLKGERGELLLGVAEPAGGGWLLRRSVAANGIEKLGFLQCGELRVQGENGGGWQVLAPPQALFCRRFCLRMPPLSGALFRRNEKGRELAFPYGERQSFPMAGLFTLARIERIGGKEYAVFSFDKNNEPIFGKK
ncbi:MAG: hypothetical protein IJC58_04385 [Oscillospiraceae bacterium]|nr:hypothetical protein [Oscillospiraceae bacterium]